MAQLLTKILEDKDEKTKQQLELLLVAAKSKLAEYEMAIKESFINPDSVNKIEVVGKRAIEWEQQYRVNTSSGVDEAVEGIINDFFTGTEDSVKNGFKNMIMIAIKTILGDARAGESEVRKFLIVPEYNAFIKVDVRFWRYNFTSTGIVSDVQDAMCFVMCKSVIDHTTLSIDELIFFVSKMFGSELNLPATKTYIEEMRKLWDAMSNKPPTMVMDEYFQARQAGRSAKRAQRKAAMAATLS